MTNINCSANCIHECNGKCTLNHIGIASSFTGETDCAYFIPRTAQDIQAKNAKKPGTF